MALVDYFNNIDLDFSRVNNRTEKTVQKKLLQMLEEADSRIANFDQKDLQDVYALTLNNLPAKYAHKGTIVMNGQVFREEIDLALEKAIEVVASNPKV